MSIPNAEPPSGHHPPEGSPNPKAAAKAAKAYAKALRPWYKKKRIVIPVGLVVVAIAGSAGSSSSIGSATASDGSGGTSGKLGQAMTNAGTTYKVTSATTTDTIGDPDVLGERTDGTFVIVNLELTNNKDETKTFTEQSAQLRTSDGKEYETSDKALLAFGDDSLMLKDIQPDLTTRGKLAFEIPTNKVSGSTLEIEDLWGSGKIKVDLGLSHVAPTQTVPNPDGEGRPDSDTHRPPRASTRHPAKNGQAPVLTACDANIRVRAATTSCPFAQNVFLSYWMDHDSPGAFAHTNGLRAYSAAADEMFAVECSGDPVVCQAGDGAYVTFPTSAVEAYTMPNAKRYAASHDTGGVDPGDIQASAPPG